MSLLRLWALAAPDRRLIFEASALIVGLRLGLAVLPFAIVQRCLDRSRVCRGSAVEAHRIVWAVNAVAARLPGATCLVVALAGHHVLRRYGHNPELRIGVRRKKKRMLDAHAWVEHQGDAVIGRTPTLGEYAVLDNRRAHSRTPY